MTDSLSPAKPPLRRIAMFRPYVSEKAIARVTEVLRSGWIGEGPLCREFEERFREVTQPPYCVAVNSGTSALHLAACLAGVAPGREVITTAQTFIATAQIILMSGAKPVFADIQYLSGNIDPAAIEQHVTEKTCAILAVHWAGYPCDLEEIHAVARKHHLVVIEDAAHAMGATCQGRPIGSHSQFTCFSFQAIKHVTTGDGGMLCLTNEDHYHCALRRRWFGIDRVRRKPTLLGEPEWNVSEIGFKYHMNDIAAALGIEHLQELPLLLRRRCEIAQAYRAVFAKVPGITLLEARDDRTSAYWIFTMHVERRMDFLGMMEDRGAAASVVHLRIDSNDVCGGMRDDLPSLARFNETQVSLPLHEGLSDDDVAYTIRCVEKGW